MNTRDKFVAEQLDRVEIPDHGPQFWRDLESAISGPADPVLNLPSNQLDSVIVPLGRPSHRRPVRWLAAAAVIVIAGIAAVPLLREPPTDTVQTAGDPGASSSLPPDSSPPADASATTAEGAVLAWIEALGTGRFEEAAEALGTRSLDYLKTLDITPSGYMTGLQEGYGTWHTASDLSTAEVELGQIAGGETTVVVLSGTWTGEGGPGPRTDAIPAVRDSDGKWLVEPAAFDPAVGGRLEVLSPRPDAESGFESLEADGFFEVAASGAGTFYFSLEDGAPVEVEGERRGNGVVGRWDPPGDLRSGRQLVVVTYVTDAILTSLATVVQVA